MTNRGDPKALFTPVYGCNPDNDTEVQVQLAFQTRETSPVGGLICVRVASGNRGYEFRYSPPDNPGSCPSSPLSSHLTIPSIRPHKPVHAGDHGPRHRRAHHNSNFNFQLSNLYANSDASAVHRHDRKEELRVPRVCA